MYIGSSVKHTACINFKFVVYSLLPIFAQGMYEAARNIKNEIDKILRGVLSQVSNKVHAILRKIDKMTLEFWDKAV